MPLAVTIAAAGAAGTPFLFVVPGNQVWHMRSVSATLSRAVGGTPNRALQLSITDGTTTVVVSPAADAGTEPGTLTATWTDAVSSAVSSGGTGVTVGALGAVAVPAGYHIIGTVLNGAAADQWTQAVAWYDYSAT